MSGGRVLKSVGDARPSRIDLSISDLLKQAKADLYTKETASSPTYSYQWMADQLGHIAIGYGLVTVMRGIISLGSLAGWLPQGAASDPWWVVGAGLVAAVGVSGYELLTYKKVARDGKGEFPLDSAGLAWNARTAAAYMIFGILLALGASFGAGVGFLVLAVLLVVGIAVAVPWLRQKIQWQRAALPFLFRLAYAQKQATADTYAPVYAFLDQVAKWSGTNHSGAPSHLLLVGTLGSGKTSLAVGIGTELAFRGTKVRYITFGKLLEMLGEGDEPEGPSGVGIWPWKNCEVLIVDDLDPGIEGQRFNAPDEVRDAIIRYGRSAPSGDDSGSIGRRCTVWIAGDIPEDDETWRTALADVLGEGSLDRIATVRLRPPPKTDVAPGGHSPAGEPLVAEA